MRHVFVSGKGSWRFVFPMGFMQADDCVVVKKVRNGCCHDTSD